LERRGERLQEKLEKQQKQEKKQPTRFLAKRRRSEPQREGRAKGKLVKTKKDGARGISAWG